MKPIRLLWNPTDSRIARASFRLECWYPHLWLSKHGFESTVLSSEPKDFPTPADKDKYDFLIWFRTDCAEHAFDSGIPVIFFLTDGPQPTREQLNRAIGIVTDCDLVYKDLMHHSQSTAFIHDTFDPPVAEPARDYYRVKPMPVAGNSKLVWVGSMGGYHWAKPTIDHLRKTWPVEIISDCEEATKPWNLATVFDDIADCDIGIIPYPTGLNFGDTKGFQPLAKDINRVVLMQAAGLPVIAAPLPAYTNYIRHGVDGMIADGPEEFEACVAVLEQFPDAMRTMSDLGKLRAWTTASSPFTGSKWARFLNGLVK